MRADRNCLDEAHYLTSSLHDRDMRADRNCVEGIKKDIASLHDRDMRADRNSHSSWLAERESLHDRDMTFAELARALDAPRSSVHGFIRGLLAKGWLYETNHRFYLGPAVYGLTLASGHIRAGLVTHADLAALQEETGVAAFLGVQAGDHLIYVAEAGSDAIASFEARSNIRRTLLTTAGGKALLTARSDGEREAYLRHRSKEEEEFVHQFLEAYEEIKRTRIATNLRLSGTRFAIATTVHNQTGEAVASVTLVGRAADLQPRAKKLSAVLLRHVDAWSQRSMKPREAI